MFASTARVDHRVSRKDLLDGLAFTRVLRGYRIVWDTEVEPPIGAHRIATPGKAAVLLQGSNVTRTNGVWRPPIGENAIARYRSPGPDPQHYALCTDLGTILAGLIPGHR